MAVKLLVYPSGEVGVEQPLAVAEAMECQVGERDKAVVEVEVEVVVVLMGMVMVVGECRNEDFGWLRCQRFV